MTRRLGVLALGLLIGGCSSTNISEAEKARAEIIEALGKDQATVCVTASYGPAQVMGARTNITNGSVKCNPSGMEVQSGQQVTVPVQIQVTPTTK